MSKEIKDSKQNVEIMEEEDDDNTLEKMKECLTCSVLKKNYIDDNSILLGYPIVRTRAIYSANKIELYPIPEMLSYEGFLSEIGNQQEKLDLYFATNFKSGNKDYNCWMPVYINKDHYEKNRQHVINSFSIIKFGPEGKEEFDFKPDQIFEILPIVLNKMIIGMFNGKSEISSKFIMSYFQYVLLYKKLCDEFEDENLAFMNKKLSLILDNEYKIDKKIIPDIGDFLMTLFYCNKDTHEEEMKKMWDSIFEEFIIRQMFWIFHSDENKERMKKIVLRTKNNETCMNLYERKQGFKMRNIDKFNQDLKDKKIFDPIIDIISKDEKFIDTLIIGRENVKEQVTSMMDNNFKRLFCSCSDEGKNQIKKIINDNLDFSDYFTLMDDELYNNYKVSDILKDNNIKNKDEIVQTAFESQKGNELLIITFFAQKKVDEKGFLQELEKNYGVYLEVDKFIEEMNKKLDEIKTYKQLLEYIGCDIYKDKTDLEIIIDAYDKAKEKDYIGSRIHPRNDNDYLITRPPRREINWDIRGRGRGRGIGGRGRGRGRGGMFHNRGRGRGRGYYRGRRYDYRRRNSRSRSRSRSNGSN